MPNASVISSAAICESANSAGRRFSSSSLANAGTDRSVANASRTSGVSTHICESNWPQAPGVPRGALTIAHQRPSVTTPTDMSEPGVRSMRCMRSNADAFHPSPGMSASVPSTGSTTSTNAASLPLIDRIPDGTAPTAPLGDDTR